MAMLEASLFYSESELASAAAEHRALAEQRAPERPRRDTGERSRLKELAGRVGWAWTRAFRRYDDYVATVAQLESEERVREHAEEKDLIAKS